jgi:hypothetical protein
MNQNWNKLIGAGISIIGGILFVVNLPSMNLILLGIGVVLFVVGIFLMR